MVAPSGIQRLMTVTDFREIQAKSILVPCGIPGIDYVINPYTGCQFGCTYCYASFMGRFIGGKTIGDWGSYVYAKANAPDLLRAELPRIKNKGKGKEVFISSVTDPYQGVEAKYKLTRRCLEVIADTGFLGTVSILTKSDLVTRDIDVIKRINRSVVGLTVTSDDDAVSRYFERFAPNVSDRFRALDKLNRQQISTYAFVGPLLPSFVANKQSLERVFKKLSEVGTTNIFVEHLNLSRYIRNRLFREMKNVDKKILEKFYLSQTQDYREELTQIVKKLVKKYKMRLMTDMVIFHKEYQKTKGERNPYSAAKSS